MADFDAATLHETIPNSHNTPDRYRQFKETLLADPLGRCGEVGPEIEFVLAREAEAGTLRRMLERGFTTVRDVGNNRNGFSTVNPNWDRVREQVIEGLDPAAPTQAAPTPSSSATPTRTTKASPSVSATPAGPAHSVTDECAYNPVPR